MSLHSRLFRVKTPQGVLELSIAADGRDVVAAVFDDRLPAKELWRASAPFYLRSGARRARMNWHGGNVHMHVEMRGDKVRMLLAFRQPAAVPRVPELRPARRVLLERVVTNPLLEPIDASTWESQAVFNAAAIRIGDRVHFLYRAVGDDGLSVLGYAASRDGEHIDERVEEPVFTDDHSFASGVANAPGPYQSGCSHAGCEDPRVTRIDDRLLMTYTAYDGEHPPGVALTSIAVKDFLEKRWNWQPPVLISSKDAAHKNWSIFPELINGKYAILHGISPRIQIEYRDSLDFDGVEPIHSEYQCSGNARSWDNRLRGAGPPPIRTDAGWLLLYHAMDCHDPGRYKVGAMLLALDDPTQIIGRLPYPLIEPDARYENEGFKQGVIYVCGAALIEGRLFVYYGGADTVVCAATLLLADLLAQLLPDARIAKNPGPLRPPREAPDDPPPPRSKQSLAHAAPGSRLGLLRGLQSVRRPD